MAIVFILILIIVIVVGAWIVPPRFEPSFSKGFNAFLGAFFAYLFIRLGEAFEKIYKNTISHLNALVTLEHVLNYCLDDIGINLFQIGEITRQLNVKDGIPRVTYNRLHPLTTKFEQIIDLKNIDLVNDLVDITLKVNRINRDIETVNVRYLDLKQSILQDTLPRGAYETTISSYLLLLGTLGKFLEDLSSRIKKCLSIVRVLAKFDRPPLSRIIYFLSNTKYNKKILIAAIEEEKKLESEINETKNKSGKLANK